MSGCFSEGPFDGGTYNDTIINSSEINNSTVTNPTITGGVTLDEQSTNDILSALCPRIPECVTIPTNEQIASVFTNCTGTPHVPGARIPTCSEVGGMLPTNEQMAGVFQTCNGTPHVPGTQIPTCAEVEAMVSNSQSMVVSTEVPPDTVQRNIPSRIVGSSREQILGAPDVWLEMTLAGGTPVLVPGWYQRTC